MEREGRRGKLIAGRRDRWVGERISGGGIGRRRGLGIGIVGEA